MTPPSESGSFPLISSESDQELVDGRYRLIRLLGQGGMGQVHEALDVFLDRKVALKFLPPLRPGTALAVAAAEAKALAAIDHPNVPVVYAFGKHRDKPYFIMELIQGNSLADVLDLYASHGETISVHRVVQIASHVTSALGAAHAAGLLHRDVKSENVIIEAESGRPVLLDFGIAVAPGTESERMAGTPAFMAPEVLRGAPATIASDIYSLGCMVYEMFTGVLPFDVVTVSDVVHAHLNLQPAPLSSHILALEPYDEVLMRALAKDPDRRFPTSAAFRAALEHVSRKDQDLSQVVDLTPTEEDAIRILVVDDDPVFARLASRAAQVAFAGVRVAVSRAKTGEAAVENAKRWPPQLLLLDYRLPGIDGVEVLSRIRGLPKGSDVCVVVMSGDGADSLRWRFSSLGVGRYLEKPVSFTELVESIVEHARLGGWVPRADAGRVTISP